jgi:hypothetical protein
LLINQTGIVQAFNAAKAIMDTDNQKQPCSLTHCGDDDADINKSPQPCNNTDAHRRILQLFACTLVIQKK